VVAMSALKSAVFRSDHTLTRLSIGAEAPHFDATTLPPSPAMERLKFVIQLSRQRRRVVDDHIVDTHPCAHAALEPDGVG